MKGPDASTASAAHHASAGHAHSTGAASVPEGPFTAPDAGEEEDSANGGEATDVSEERTLTGQELTDDQRKEVDRLKERDREVRAHEQAHVAAGGQYVRGGIQFEYQTGPDGRRYAVGGEVSIDSSPIPGDPQKTIQKAQQIRRAAMAPAEPSGQDRRVASAPSQMEVKARQELIEQRIEGEDGDEPAVGAENEFVKSVAAESEDDSEEAMEVPGGKPADPSPGISGDEGDVEEGVVDMAELMGDVVTGPGSFDPPAFDIVPTGEEKDEDRPFGKVGFSRWICRRSRAQDRQVVS